MKYYGVTFQMKPLQQYFHMVLFVLYVVLTFESVDETLWCYHSNETSSTVLSHGTICFVLCSSNVFVRWWNPIIIIIIIPLFILIENRSAEHRGPAGINRWSAIVIKKRIKELRMLKICKIKGSLTQKLKIYIKIQKKKKIIFSSTDVLLLIQFQ